jgi:4-hydroxy-4-methyl-2-oxoglutarate aldolase
MSIGDRAFTKVDRPDPSLVSQLVLCDTADLSDAMRRSHTMVGIHGMWPNPGRVAGPAVTASMPLGGVNLIRLAMNASQAGDVLVLAARGVEHVAFWGGHISEAMVNRGLAGVIVDGAIRDLEEVASAGLPIYARGVATAACTPEAPGEINVPVACGSIVVEPGDIVVADANGVVVVPDDSATAVLAAVKEIKAMQDSWADDMAKGAVPGIDATIEKAIERGFEFVTD